MPAPRWLARLNRIGLNRITRHATRVPGFGVVVHQGRKTGRVYRTPVNVFAKPGGYTIALTYGTRSEWLRNVLAAGACILETGGRRVHLIHPRVVHDPAHRAVPAPVGLILGLLEVSDFLELDLDSTEARARARRVPTWVPWFNPITIIEDSGGHWVLAPFGEVDWVRNLRAAGKGRGRPVFKLKQM